MYEHFLQQGLEMEDEGGDFFIIIHLHDLLTHLVPYDFIIYIYFFCFLNNLQVESINLKSHATSGGGL